MGVLEAKVALDAVLKKSRVHFYKPIQIAEILYKNRTTELKLDSLDHYRTQSKIWRDQISMRLVGSVSTSSSRFQDNLFEENAVPPRHISSLGDFNRDNDGAVEAYIYLSMLAKMSGIQAIHDYLEKADYQDFDLMELLDFFETTAGLRRSTDKIYEIIAYALFTAIIEALEVSVSVTINTNETRLLEDFSDFTSKVVGIAGGQQRMEPARVFRVGATNANDGGIDLWANYGPAIQVKHFSINSEHLESITNGVQADRFIVVCTDADVEIIKSVLKQAGTFPKVQSIVTLSDLQNWYQRAYSGEYIGWIGKNLRNSLLAEFEFEFPINSELPSFLEHRGYAEKPLPQGWVLPDLTNREVS